MVSRVMRTRRSVIELVYEMLSACSNGGINKTSIMCSCEMSYNQMSRYLTKLCDQGLVRAGSDGQYQITSRGRRALQRASAVIQTLTPSKD